MREEPHQGTSEPSTSLMQPAATGSSLLGQRPLIRSDNGVVKNPKTVVVTIIFMWYCLLIVGSSSYHRRLLTSSKISKCNSYRDTWANANAEKFGRPKQHNIEASPDPGNLLCVFPQKYQRDRSTSLRRKNILYLLQKCQPPNNCEIPTMSRT